MSKIIKIIILVIVLAVIGMGIYIYASLKTAKVMREGVREKANEARAMADMAQVNTAALMIYSDEGSYTDVNCENYRIKHMCNDIEMMIGSKPIIYSSKEDYCAYIKLPSRDRYFCIDSVPFSAGRIVAINPEEMGYCDGTTFICPLEER